jgi:eukaryotic-like serine/threonine-protein kinase
MRNAPVQAGDILAGKYRVERLLGTGSMGIVVEAVHVELGQRVAVKFMRSASTVDADARERFLREARAAVRLRSQHVARVLDVGTLDGGAPYIVMEFLEGRDLAALLKDSGPLPIDEAVEYVLQTCEAVGEAHAAGIVHRDLKPANLFVTQDVSGSPCVKVLDFGISKISGAALALTDDSQALGSPLYMSPEQMSSSRDVDARTDIWALGVLLYELIAGQTPFHSETLPELYGRVLTGRPSPLRERRSDVPPELDAAILRCLHGDREQRWKDVAEFVGALAPHAPARARAYPERVARVLGFRGASSARIAEVPSSRRVEATPRPAGAEASTPLASSSPNTGAETALTVSSPHGSSSSSEAQPARLRHHAPLLVAGAIVAVAALAVIFGAVWVWNPPPAPTGAPTGASQAQTAALPAAIEPQDPPSAPVPQASSAPSPAEAVSAAPGAMSSAALKAAKPPLRAKPPARGAPDAKPSPTVSYDDRR